MAAVRAKIRWSLAALAAIALVHGAGAAGSYPNAAIADRALTYVGHPTGKACRAAAKPTGTFVDCILWLASGHTQYPAGTSFQSFLNAGGAEITAVGSLVKGDIVESRAGSRAFIVVEHVSGDVFLVVEPGAQGNVTKDRRAVVLGGKARAVRMGAVAAPSPAPAPAPNLSDAVHVVVPPGQPVQIAFAADPGYNGAASLANAVQMAVSDHPAVAGFKVAINTINAPTCGNPNPVPPATAAASRITANLQNVAVIGQVCSHGFAEALAIYEQAHLVVVSGSATGTGLPAAGPTVFNRTIVDDNRIDYWYPVISQLPIDLAWRQDYTNRFGAPPADYADLYYDAASLVIGDLAAASSVDAQGDLIVNRAALAHAVRTTSGYQRVSCSVTIDPATGDRTVDDAAISNCGG